MEKELEISIQKLDWYQLLLEDLKAIIVERGKNSRMELLQGKWEVGKRVLEDELNFRRAGYGERIVETIAKDLGISAVHLWKCIQFYKKYPFPSFDEVVSYLPEGANISWWKMSSRYLPQHKDEIEAEKELEERQKACEHPEIVSKCKKCKKEFTWEELMLLWEKTKRKTE